MALDHTRDFFHVFSPKPTDLATTTPILFFTRWITHFCAALFVFLSGVSANIAGTRRTKKELSGFLIKRGLWLITVELLITFVITLDPRFHLFIFQIIFVIGVCMIVLGLLVWLPLYVTGIVGVLLFFGHNILNYINLPAQGTSGFLWKFFFTAAALFQKIDDNHSILVLYTIMPWMGVMFTGYVIGQIFRPGFDTAKRKKILSYSGVGLVILFVLFRFFNVYGDPSPWKTQGNTVLSVLSFFNVSKYPPSLMYLCMTIGPGLLLLSATEQTNNAFTRFVSVYGKVPFFYYVLHFYLLRLLNVLLFYVQGYGSENIVTPKSIMLFRPVEYGLNLFGVYVVWLIAILLLYFPCRWFSNYKKTHGQWWLSYL